MNQGDFTSPRSVRDIPPAISEALQRLEDLVRRRGSSKDSDAVALVRSALPREEPQPAPRTFPILGTAQRIPWAMAEEAYEDYAIRYGKAQTLERLAERGGFAPEEMDVLLPGWHERLAPPAPSGEALEALTRLLDAAHTVIESGLLHGPMVIHDTTREKLIGAASEAEDVLALVRAQFGSPPSPPKEG